MTADKEAALLAAYRELEQRLAEIRQHTDAGDLTPLEAANDRIAALEAHLRRCREIRGGDS